MKLFKLLIERKLAISIDVDAKIVQFIGTFTSSDSITPKDRQFKRDISIWITARIIIETNILRLLQT